MWDAIKGVFKKVGEAIVGAGKKALDWIKDGGSWLAEQFKKFSKFLGDLFGDAGDAMGNAAESAGNAINDGVKWVGNKIRINPITDWLGRMFKGVFDIVGGLIKGVIGVVGGVIEGGLKILGGILSLSWSLILEGLWDIASPIFGLVIVVGGKFIALMQSMFYAQGPERSLTKEEKAKLERVFKDSLNYYVIKIIEGRSGLFGINDRPFVLSNTIYMKSDSFSDSSLVHEATHVWQYQQIGDRYASDAIFAQWFVTDEYNWEREINVRGKDDWSDFNKEAQARFLENLWDEGELRDAAGNPLSSQNGCFYDADEKNTFGHFEVNGKDYSKIANNAVKTVRKEWF